MVTVVLGDDGRRNWISEYLPAQNRSLQVDEGTRADDITVRNRKNKRNDFRITVHREHDNIRAAHIFLRDHADQVPIIGIVTIEELSGGSAVATLESAGIPSVQCVRHDGVYTVFTYQIVAGKFS
jgi:hypothetical protein